MISLAEIDPSVLRELLRYEPDTGHLYWRPRDRVWFQTKRSFASWNGKFAAKRALTFLTVDGYLSGTLLWQPVLAHRVILAMVNGKWPDHCDHENGIRSDNRLLNLRDTDASGNSMNRGIRLDNTSGQVGVQKCRNRWLARITVDRKDVFLGVFQAKNDAIAARLTAEKKYGYHPNHGSVR